ncbi:hypothetical protein AsFPU1_0572 [Aphanothece sacrum FPU1]|uniref:Uncharacterized protein n=1 Tax=Aphanothece sacrum FPU1 TaxID=1920663 RepID=A0A401IDC6_APHSA|nr:hypothetical protein AsFPU1_0572 [Aphanothece sacrum FPU1]GBF86569.1 hypothetical protein AsFPU3_3640 [Aphanothece sacrum FPU3]
MNPRLRNKLALSPQNIAKCKGGQKYFVVITRDSVISSAQEYPTTAYPNYVSPYIDCRRYDIRLLYQTNF